MEPPAPYPSALIFVANLAFNLASLGEITTWQYDCRE